MTNITNNINVIKLGGNAGVDHSAVLKNLAVRIQNGERWVLVHGASGLANQLGEDVGHPAQTITSPSGHTSRYNDARTIEVFSMAAGAVNQQLATELASYGVRVMGLAGSHTVRAERKKAIRALRKGRQVVIRDDYSGSITGVEDDTLHLLLQNDLTPIVAPLAMSEDHERLNVDGDLVAATIAKALDADTLIILSNVPGLLRDVEKPDSLINQIPLNKVEDYADFAKGRMKKKLLAAQQAQVNRMILADSRLENPIDAALNGDGTHIIREAIHA